MANVLYASEGHIIIRRPATQSVGFGTKLLDSVIFEFWRLMCSGKSNPDTLEIRISETYQLCSVNVKCLDCLRS